MYLEVILSKQVPNLLIIMNEMYHLKKVRDFKSVQVIREGDLKIHIKGTRWVDVFKGFSKVLDEEGVKGVRVDIPEITVKDWPTRIALNILFKMI